MWTGTQGHRDVHAREQQAYPSQSERLALVGLARQWPGLRDYTRPLERQPDYGLKQERHRHASRVKHTVHDPAAPAQWP